MATRDPPHILLVEDDAFSQDMLVRRLAARGFRVTATSDGETALARVAEAAPDLVLVDVNLPGIGGLDVLRRLRSAYARDALSVILMTALGEDADVIAGLEVGELLHRLRDVARSGAVPYPQRVEMLEGRWGKVSVTV